RVPVLRSSRAHAAREEGPRRPRAPQERSMSNTKPSKTKPTAKAKGISLHIGLNRVDPAHYQGWAGELLGCENDANDLAAIAQKSGFTASVLLTEAGTTAAVQRGIGAAASRLEAG